MTDSTSPADQLRSDVLDELDTHLTDVTAANTSAELWHSGGGIIGLKVTVGRSELFTTLEADGDQAFVIADWATIARSRPRWSDDLIGTIEIQVRPHGATVMGEARPADDPATIAEAIAAVINRLR